VVRTDLATFTLKGDNAFDTLVEAFKLTPGLRLADAQLCYGAQSGDVFVTAVDQNNEQQFIVIAKTATIDKWQQYMQQQGFSVTNTQAA
jgi:aminomethyltransferase